MTHGPRNNPTFFSVLSDAIHDLIEHGYDDPNRLQDWLTKLRLAAVAWLPSEERVRNQMQQALWLSFKRATSKRTLMRQHPGIERFVLDRLDSEMRRLLDARILASVDLIKLNRNQAIEKTLQRFSGWATSVPAGGSRTVEMRDVKEHIGKPLKNTRFEQRRLEIDQGHKLAASISASIAEASGAIAAIWRSNFRQAGYDYRPDHKDRDGKVYLIRDSWAKKDGLVKPGPAGYTDQITEPSIEINCRCWYLYLNSLRELPDDMLTRKGRESLLENRLKRA